MTEPWELKDRECRKVSLLLTLRTLNDDGKAPTSTQLINTNNSMRPLARSTVQVRRRYITNMRQRGFITSKMNPGSPALEHMITAAGRKALAGLGYDELTG